MCEDVWGVPSSVCASTRVCMASGEKMFKNGVVSPELTGTVSKVPRRQEQPRLPQLPGRKWPCFVLRRHCDWDKASGAGPKTSLIKETH